jgi:hypothetical protein
MVEGRRGKMIGWTNKRNEIAVLARKEGDKDIKLFYLLSFFVHL